MVETGEKAHHTSSKGTKKQTRIKQDHIKSENGIIDSSKIPNIKREPLSLEDLLLKKKQLEEAECKVKLIILIKILFFLIL